MTDTERLTQLKQILASHLIRERRAGIKMAAEMLTNNMHSDEVRILLENLAKNDLITTVQEDARRALAAEDIRLHPTPAAPPDYVFGAKCANGHVSYYDKREYCPRNSSLTRRTTTRGSREVDEILLHCKTKGCGEEFFVEVDCKGYK